MKEKHFDFVFVVLVYRNVNDLGNFFKQFNVPNSHIVVVNSYFDDFSFMEMKKISYDNNADFINVENKGYGYGNNKGVEYALKYFIFDFLVISNSDIGIINYLPAKDLLTDGIIAPDIITNSSKKQNPYIPFYLKCCDKLKYFGYKYDLNILLWCIYFFTRFVRELFLCYTFVYKKNAYKVFSAHGAHLIISNSALRKIYPLFDETMFLFKEEDHLALLAKKYNIPIYYVPSIKIKHYLGGSVQFLKKTPNNYVYVKDSYMKYYKTWYD